MILHMRNYTRVLIACWQMYEEALMRFFVSYFIKLPFKSLGSVSFFFFLLFFIEKNKCIYYRKYINLIKMLLNKQFK